MIIHKKPQINQNYNQNKLIANRVYQSLANSF